MSYGTWNTNNPGWDDIEQAESGLQKVERKQAKIKATKLEKVEGVDTNQSEARRRYFGKKQTIIWYPGTAADSIRFKNSKNLYTYIENHKSLDTQKIQNDRLTEYLKREKTIGKSMRQVIASLKEVGYNKGLCNQTVLDDYFGGVEVSTNHLSDEFEVNEATFLSASRKLNSVTNDTNSAQITRSLKDIPNDFITLIETTLYTYSL